jgi:hypothetical protein
MIDWTLITEDQWRTTSDKQLAATLGCTRANVGAARKRYSSHPSPSGHGGTRDGAGRKQSGDDDQLTSVTVNLTKGQKRSLMEKHKAAGMNWNAWALSRLEGSD